MFSYGSSSSISFATVTPSFVTVGDPNDFSSTTFRPEGPSVTFTARASFETPRRIASRASWSNAILFAAIVGAPDSLVCQLSADRQLIDHGQDVILGHDHQLFIIDLHLGPRVRSKNHLIPLLHVPRRPLPVLQPLPIPQRNNLPPLRLLLSRIRQHNP